MIGQTTTQRLGEGQGVIGTVLNERFLLEKELGRGGMGAVYRATDQLLGRSVAIKVLKELTGEEVGRKIRLEAQILARLVHEHIVRLYDFGIAQGTYFLVMEEVDGTSFQKRWKKVTVPERLQILVQTAEALDYAHHQGVIHRDVKPANILLTSTDQTKLSDFGLSLRAEEACDSETTKGTPHYMSPEQARGRKLDHRSDLYALGVILYECMAGGAPFQGPAASVMSQHVSALPEPPRQRGAEISDWCETLILRLLAKNPDERPASGKAVAEELRALINNDAWKGPVVAGARAAAAPAPQAEPTVPSAQPVPASVRQPVPTFTTSLPAAPPSLARTLIEEVEAAPIMLTPDERYLFGHYLAYLLGGSLRQGILRRYRLDRRNADRARLLLAMASIMTAGGSDEAIGRGAELLASKIDVRPSLSPIIVAKYLAARETELKRKRFRQARKRLRDASEYAQKHMLDARGGLNPGLMPLVIDDLREIAPARTDIDDQLVERWNRIADAWRANYAFRDAVLRYATLRANRDPASFGLWPEVVYPLIERARWQRRNRSKLEEFWDVICSNLRLPDSGLKLDQAISREIPVQVVEKLDLGLDEFREEPEIDEPAEPPDREASLSLGPAAAVSFDELAADGADNGPRGVVRLTSPDPLRLTLADLNALWKEAIAALKTPSSRIVHRLVPIGPYRIVVIPTIRGKSAGNVAIQGMPNKQIELLTPSLRAAGGTTRPVIAVWLYQNNSLVVSYLDFKNTERFILWDATIGHQSNYDDPSTLNHNLLQLGLEAPDQLDRALSKRFRPRNPV